MMIKQGFASKAVAMALCAGLAAPSIAQTNDWMSSCLPYQQARQAQNGATVGGVADADPYLLGMATKDVAGPSSAQIAAGQNGGSFSCSGTVKGVFDSVLQSAGSMFGIDLGTLFGNIPGAASGNLCGQVNQSIGKTFGGMNVSCPRVNIPGFNNSCGIGLSGNSNGISVRTNGALGGYSFNGNGGVNPNGTTVRANTNIGTLGGGPATSSSAPAASSGGIGSSVACWFTGNC
jgi:hypothetical protein